MSIESPNQIGSVEWAEALKIQRELILRAVGQEGTTAEKADWIERNAENFREIIENNSEIISLLREDYETGLSRFEELLREMTSPSQKAA